MRPIKICEKNKEKIEADLSPTHTVHILDSQQKSASRGLAAAGNLRLGCNMDEFNIHESRGLTAYEIIQKEIEEVGQIRIRRKDFWSALSEMTPAQVHKCLYQASRTKEIITIKDEQ